MINAKFQRASQRPSVRARAAATNRRIMKWRVAHGIAKGQKLTLEQLTEARGGTPPSKFTMRVRGFGKAARTVKGSMPIDKNLPRPAPRERSSTYVTSGRIAFGHDVARLVKRALDGHDKALALGLVQMVNRLLNGGH